VVDQNLLDQKRLKGQEKHNINMLSLINSVNKKDNNKKKETKTNGQFELARVSLLSFILLKFNVS